MLTRPSSAHRDFRIKNLQRSPSGKKEKPNESDLHRPYCGLDAALDESANAGRPPGHLARAKPSVDTLQQFALIANIDEVPRARSKLYLLLKGILKDPQARYREADFRLCLDENHAQFVNGMRDISAIDAVLRRKGIKFTVIIAPYEYQLRTLGEAVFLPQQELRDYFTQNSIGCVDCAPLFAKQHVGSREFSLPYDRVHFSEKGREVIYDIIVHRIRTS